MKKIFTLGLTALLLAVCSAKVNAQAFEEGKSYVSVSYGYALFDFTKLLIKSDPNLDFLMEESLFLGVLLDEKSLQSC